MNDEFDFPFQETGYLPFAPGTDSADRLKEIEELFAPFHADNAKEMGLTELILVSWPDAKVRLTSKGRAFYRKACEHVGIAPGHVRTLKQFEQVRRMDAELLLQDFLESELQPFEHESR